MKKIRICFTILISIVVIEACTPRETKFTTPLATIPTDGLIAYYPFDGNANDESGYKHHGEINQGVTLTTDRKSNKDKAYNFGGVDKIGYIKINNSENFALSGALTISVWYKLNSYYGMDSYARPNQNGYHVLLAKEGDRDGFYLAIDNNPSTNKQNLAFYNKKSFIPNFSINGNPSGTNVENTNKWIHSATVIDGTRAKLYVNGSLIQTTTISPDFSSANAKNLYIGTMWALSTAWYPFNGALDDIRLYNRSLSDAEVLALSQE